MDVQDVVTHARDTLTVKRVFGAPYEKDGVTVIPVARVRGDVGVGRGEVGPGEKKGSGGGFGMDAAPVGTYVIRGAEPCWRPGVDVDRIVLGCQLVAVVALPGLRSTTETGAKVGARPTGGLP